LETTEGESVIMIGNCSIKDCRNNESFKKIHESFEALEDFNICWECGSKILDALEPLSEVGE
jgi:hypothetical protein